MKLYEFEGLELLKEAGIESPFFVVCKNLADVKAARSKFKFPIVAKVQVLSGGRGKHGGVKEISRESGLIDFANENFRREFLGERVRFIVLAQIVEFEAEYYISCNYDTSTSRPYILFSERGGVNVEEKNFDENFLRVDIDPNIGVEKAHFKKWPVDFDFIEKLWQVFSGSDARLVEINPLVRFKNVGSDSGRAKFLALDAKVVLDDNGFLRHEGIKVMPKGAVSAVPTERELQAKKIDESDYRGSAGSAFVEMAGDIAVMASGGGASLLVMDALIASGGKAANYTEYSGNPSRDKVKKLTKVVLSKKGLSGCLVAGAVANFTDIFETLSGFAEALKVIKPDYPIVVRRGGPRQEEAYKMLSVFAKKEGVDIHLYGPETPISVAAKEMVRLSEEYKKRKFSTGSKNTSTPVSTSIVRAKSRTS